MAFLHKQAEDNMLTREFKGKDAKILKSEVCKFDVRIMSFFDINEIPFVNNLNEVHLISLENTAKVDALVEPIALEEVKQNAKSLGLNKKDLNWLAIEKKALLFEFRQVRNTILLYTKFHPKRYLTLPVNDMRDLKKLIGKSINEQLCNFKYKTAMCLRSFFNYCARTYFDTYAQILSIENNQKLLTVDDWIIERVETKEE